MASFKHKYQEGAGGGADVNVASMDQKRKRGHQNMDTGGGPQQKKGTELKSTGSKANKEPPASNIPEDHYEPLQWQRTRAAEERNNNSLPEMMPGEDLAMIVGYHNDSGPVWTYIPPDGKEDTPFIHIYCHMENDKKKKISQAKIARVHKRYTTATDNDEARKDQKAFNYLIVADMLRVKPGHLSLKLKLDLRKSDLTRLKSGPKPKLVAQNQLIQSRAQIRLLFPAYPKVCHFRSSQNIIEYYLTNTLTSEQFILDFSSQVIDSHDIRVAHLFTMDCDEEIRKVLLGSTYHCKFFHAVGVELSNRLEIADFDFPWLLNDYHKLKGLKEEELLRSTQQHHNLPAEMDRLAIEKAFATFYDVKRMFVEFTETLGITPTSAETQTLLIEKARSSTRVVDWESNPELLKTIILSHNLLPVVDVLNKIAGMELDWVMTENARDNGCQEILSILARHGYSAHGVLKEVAGSN